MFPLCVGSPFVCNVAAAATCVATVAGDTAAAAGDTAAAAGIMTIETDALTESDFDSFLHLTHSWSTE